MSSAKIIASINNRVGPPSNSISQEFTSSPPQLATADKKIISAQSGIQVKARPSLRLDSGSRDVQKVLAGPDRLTKPSKQATLQGLLLKGRSVNYYQKVSLGLKASFEAEQRP